MSGRKIIDGLNEAISDGPRLRSVGVTAAHDVAYREIYELVTRRAKGVTAREMLAIAANLVGKLVAMQDHRTTTPDMAMALVAANIEAGNKQAVDALMQSKGSA